MKLRARAIVEVSAADAFADFTNTARLEAEMRARGISFERRDAPGGSTVGTEWQAEVDVRGKPREVLVRVTRHTPPSGFALAGRIGGLHADTDVLFRPLSDTRTEVTLESRLTAKSVKAGMILGSLRMARTRAEQRIARRLSAIGAECERRVAAGQSLRGSAG